MAPLVDKAQQDGYNILLHHMGGLFQHPYNAIGTLNTHLLDAVIDSAGVGFVLALKTSADILIFKWDCDVLIVDGVGRSRR